MSQIRTKAVFLFDEPSVGQLKGCALFWERTIVYEGYIQSLVEFPEMVSLVHGLLEHDVLKIAQTPEDLQSGLFDKVYAGLDEKLWNYIHDNAAKVTVQPQLPDDYEEIVKTSSETDYGNKELKKLYDSIEHERVLEQWIEGVRESKYFPYAPPEAKREVLKKMMEMAEMQYSHFHSSQPERTRYHFETLNKLLIEQLALSSALCVDSFWSTLFRYKLGDFGIKDAKTCLEGLEVIVPFAERNSIQDYSLDEILKLRKNNKWNKAMDKLASLCLDVRSQTDASRFKDQLTHEVLREYQYALEEERMTEKKLVTTLGKGLVYTGISLIPVAGSVISAATGIADPLLDFLRKREKQENLAFFLNDMRNLGNAKE